MTRREPEWDDTERAVMLAYTDYRADTCSGCGNSLTESTDPANEGMYRVPMPVRCHACTPLEVAFDQYRDAQQPRALRFHTDLIGS